MSSLLSEGKPGTAGSGSGICNLVLLSTIRDDYVGLGVIIISSRLWLARFSNVYEMSILNLFCNFKNDFDFAVLNQESIQRVME